MKNIIEFIMKNKKWLIIPIVIVLVLIGVLMLFWGTENPDVIYKQ